MRMIDLTEGIAPHLEKQFGRILFGDWQFTTGLTKHHEPDTNYEKQVYKAVKDWIEGEHNKVKTQNKIIELSRMKDDYPTLLRPDSASKFPKLYRGLYGHTAKGKFRRINSKSSYTMTLKGGTSLYRSELKMEYKPKKLAESWTTSKKAAYEFLKYQQGYFDPKKVIIIEATVPQDERLFKTRTMNLLGVKEHEIIRVSKKSLLVTVYYASNY